ncbi:cellulase family glycosylhydrolase, partial [bacterium]|nr:cellulase family glycosylhydrolase [bacterium]
MILRAFPTARLLALVLAACPTQAGGQEALLANGDFQSDADEDGKPDHWAVPEGASAKVEGGNRFLRLHAQPEKMLMVYRAVAVRPGHKAYALSFRVRINQLEPGKKAWHDGRIILDFKDAAGEKLEPGPPHPNFRGTRDWQTRRVEFLAPAGAATLEILPAMFMVESGSFDLDDMALTATDPEPILQKQKEAEARRQAEIERRAARVKPQAPKAPADKLPPMLEVMGNQIRDANGKSVWLQGLAIPSMEWSAAGEHILESVRVAIDDWHANVIRLPVREDFWAGKGPWQNDGGAGYRQLLDDAVNVAGGRGVYVVVDLHRYRAPIQAHADFWQALAKKYKNHPAVLFELMNEPHDISWEVWRDGGAVAVEKKNTDALAENKQKLRTFESVGMQRLIDVIRKTGARNIVIVGGLDWGYDLSGVLEGFAVD